MVTTKQLEAHLQNARTICPILPWKAYQITDVMARYLRDVSSFFNDDNNTKVRANQITFLLSQLKSDCEASVPAYYGFKLPEALKINDAGLEQGFYRLTWLIDCMEDSDFVQEFRTSWSHTFNPMLPKRNNTSFSSNVKPHPGNIQVAIDWWADILLYPQGDTRYNIKYLIPKYISMIDIDAKQLEIFKETLAQEIAKEIADSGKSVIGAMDTKGSPNLQKALKASDLDKYIILPVDTHTMLVTPDMVTCNTAPNSTERIW